MQSSSNQASCLSLSRLSCSSRNSSVSSFISKCRESKLFLCHRLNAGFQDTRRAQQRIRNNSFLRQKLNRPPSISASDLFVTRAKKEVSRILDSRNTGSSLVFFRNVGKANYPRLVEKPLLSIRNGIVISSFPTTMKIPSPFNSLPRTIHDNRKASLCFVIVSALDPNPIRTTRLNIERV